MALVFPYKLVSLNRPAVALGGRWVRPRPIVPLTITGPAKSRQQEALLDTGADDTVFPAHWAVDLGIDLSNAPIGSASGIASSPIILRYALVTLTLADGHEHREWEAL